MVINDAHRFIFVHVPKAAGTSITEALAALPGNSPSCVHPRTKHESLAALLARVGTGTVGECSRGADLASYLAFGFVRNPWARIASLYRYLVEERPRPEIEAIGSFGEFLLRARAREPWIAGLHSMRPQLEFFEGTGVQAFVGHYEHLQEDFATVTRRLRCDAPLPRRNVSSNSARDYRRDYAAGTNGIVGELFPRDVEFFGYEFETAVPRKRLSGFLIA